MLYRMTKDRLVPVGETSAPTQSLSEADIESLVERTPDVLGEDLLVIGRQVEVGGGKDRLDLLALDRQANLVVIELKAELIGHDADLQALRYAAMVSTWDHAAVRAVAESHWGNTAQQRRTFTQALDEFCDEGYEVNAAQRLVLVGRDVRPRIGTMALWLRRHGVDIRVVGLSLFRDQDTLYVQPQILIPVTSEADVVARPGPAATDKEWLRDGRNWHLEQRLSETGRALAECLIELVGQAVPEANGPVFAQKNYIAWRQGSRNWLGCYTDSPNQLAVYIQGLGRIEPAEVASALGWESFDAEAELADKLALGSSVGRDGKGRFVLRVKQDAGIDAEAAEPLARLLRQAWEMFASGTAEPAW